MDIQNNFNARGSFGIPEHMRKQLEATQKPQPKAPEAQASTGSVQAEPQAQPTGTPADPTTAATTASSAAEPEDQKQKDIQELREFWEKRLDIKITDRDIRDYIFKGRLIKENIDAVPGFMRTTFQSLNPEELGEIDQRMAEFDANARFTKDGLPNEHALRVLSFGWLKSAEVDGDVIKASKSMGNTPDERYASIRKIGALGVQEVIEAWDGFNILIKVTLREKRLLKKY